MSEHEAAITFLVENGYREAARELSNRALLFHQHRNEARKAALEEAADIADNFDHGAHAAANIRALIDKEKQNEAT